MCGIFGWHGSRLKTFNPYKIAILGLLNDSRGGDGCGLSVNGKIKKEAGKIEKFSDFLNKDIYEFLLSNKENTVLGHARKTSVGKSILENTHPFGHGDYKDGFEVILTHNGTIHNYEDLAKKYNIDIEGGTDSYMLSKFLHEDFNTFLKILSEYNGAAAIAAYDRKENTFILFKGESKRSNVSTIIDEERPLSIAYVDQSNFYYSSEKKHLLAAGFQEDKIIDLKTNTVFIFRNGEIISEHKVDRSKSFQNKIYSYSRSVTPVNKPNKIYSNEYYSDGYWDDYYDDSCSCGAVVPFYEKNKTPSSNEDKWNRYKTPLTKDINTIRTADNTMSNYIALPEKATLYMRKNRYYIKGGSIANGYGFIDNNGFIVPITAFRDSNLFKYLYFKDGIAFKIYNADIDVSILKNNSSILAYPTFVSKNNTSKIVNPGKDEQNLPLSRKEGLIPLFDRDKDGNLIGFLGKPIKEHNFKVLTKQDLFAIYDSYVLSKDKFDIAFFNEISKSRPKNAVDAFKIILDLEMQELSVLMEEAQIDLDEIKNIIGDDFNII